MEKYPELVQKALDYVFSAESKNSGKSYGSFNVPDIDAGRAVIDLMHGKNG